MGKVRNIQSNKTTVSLNRKEDHGMNSSFIQNWVPLKAIFSQTRHEETEAVDKRMICMSQCTVLHGNHVGYRSFPILETAINLLLNLCR